MKLNVLQKILSTLIITTITIILIYGVFFSKAVVKYGFDLIQISKYYVLQSPIETIKNMMNDFNFMNNQTATLKSIQQNDLLEKRYYAENLELRQQIAQLEKMLNFQNSNTQFKFATASIISRNFDAFNDAFVINIGENQNVKVGNAVVGDSGLIGKITSVSKNTATVSLLTSKSHNHQLTTSIIQNDEIIHAIVQRYDHSNGVLNVRVLDETKKISLNSIVTTSNITESYPAGVLIGKVQSVSPLINEIGNIVQVKIAENLNDIRFVGVIVGKK